MSLTNKSNSIATGSDVLLSGLADGQVLTYNAASSRWKNATPISGSGGSTSVVQNKTLYATELPASTGLTSLVADGTTDDASRLQAALNYIKNTYGAGTLVLPPATIKLASGVSIPAGVRMIGHHSTKSKLQYTATSGAAVSVNDGSCTPVEGFYIAGPGGTNTATGLSVTGARMAFRDLEIRYFNKGIDMCHDDTYIVSFTDCRIGNNTWCVWDDIAGKSGSAVINNSGERLVFQSCLFDNSTSIGYFSANGPSTYFIGCSLDYTASFGTYWDQNTFFIGCHIETTGSASGGRDYLIHLDGNAKMSLNSCSVIIGGTGIIHLTDQSQGPYNYGSGNLRLHNIDIYYTPPASGTTVSRSSFAVRLESGVSSFSGYSALVSRWSSMSVKFVQSDTMLPPAGLTPMITSIEQNTGAFTISLGGTLSAAAMLMIEMA